MTPLERKYLGRGNVRLTFISEKRVKFWHEWFADILMGIALALVFVALVLVAAGALITLTPGVRAEEKQDNAYFCRQIAEGKANVATEDREAVTSYCAKYL